MIAIGCDHGGYKVKEEIKKYLREEAILFKDFGSVSEERVDYPDIASEVAKSVQSNETQKGILICKSGIGMTITANKYKGIRCALCYNEETAKNAKIHNDSNILAIGADQLSMNEIINIVRLWLVSEFEGGRHQVRINLIKEIEKENMI